MPLVINLLIMSIKVRKVKGEWNVFSKLETQQFLVFPICCRMSVVCFFLIKAEEVIVLLREGIFVVALIAASIDSYVFEYTSYEVDLD